MLEGRIARRAKTVGFREFTRAGLSNWLLPWVLFFRAKRALARIQPMFALIGHGVLHVKTGTTLLVNLIVDEAVVGQHDWR